MLVICNLQACYLAYEDEYGKEHLNFPVYCIAIFLFATLALVAHYKAQHYDPGFLPVRLDAEGKRCYDESNEFSCRRCGADRTNYEP